MLYMMKSIEKYLKQFERYFNGDLDPAQKLAFEDLLQKNGGVHHAWKEYCSIMDACSDHEVISFRLKLEQAFENRTANNPRIVNNLFLKMGAAAIFIILIGSLTYLYNTGGGKWDDQNKIVVVDGNENKQCLLDTTSKFVLSVNDSLVQPEQNTIQTTEVASIYDMEKYQISPVFAELLHNVYRSNWFRILSPGDSVLVAPGEMISFNWETNIKEPLYFDILDRNGNVIHKEATPISSSWTFTPNLSPAIYMYRISTVDQPVWMGVVVAIE